MKKHSKNPFPSDDEVRFMTDLGRQLLACEFHTSLDEPGFNADAGFRSSLLAKCLRDAREASAWTVKLCAHALNTKPAQLRSLEGGHFEPKNAGLLGRYVHFLGLQEVYQQWLAVNTNLATQLGLSALSDALPRPAEWPEPRPFILAPEAFRLSPEKKQLLRGHLDAIEGADAFLGALRNGPLGGALAEDPRREPLPPAIYQFKISLRYLTPAIWRRFQASNEITLGQFHDMIQIVMGWENSHLHEFRIGKDSFGMTSDPMGGDLDMVDSLDENDYRLSELGLRVKSKLSYQYDFGDDWTHQIVLEKVLPFQPGFAPVCVKGVRACPAEDSGGPYGYAETLAILADPRHPAHKETSEWIGDGFNPEAFNLDEVNRRLAALGQRWKKEVVRKRRAIKQS